MTGRIAVRPLPVMDEAEWQFKDSRPQWQWGDWGTAATFDPFPAYPHDQDEVERMAELVESRWAPAWDVELFIADREEVGRSNGFSNIQEHYKREGQPTGLIVLSGKRVPPHPAMTRYLVAHEYGHNVEWMLKRVRDPEGSLYSDDLLSQYAEARGMAGPVHHGSGGRWHNSIVEVFACDFRIVVCGVEPDFWPHPGVPRPEEVPQIRDWWAHAFHDATVSAGAAT